MPSVLILAYGNPLRGDDGIAWCAAEALQRILPSSRTEILFLSQLTPELAEPISQADAIIFLDAATEGRPGKITCAPVNAEAQRPGFSHQMTPQSLLAFCAQLDAPRPRAFVVSMTGQSFDAPDALSNEARSALPQLVSTVQQLVDRLMQPSSD